MPVHSRSPDQKPPRLPAEERLPMVVGGRGLAEAINGVLEATFLLPEQAAALATRPRVGCGELTLSYLAEYLDWRQRQGLDECMLPVRAGLSGPRGPD